MNQIYWLLLSFHHIDYLVLIIVEERMVIDNQIDSEYDMAIDDEIWLHYI